MPSEQHLANRRNVAATIGAALLHEASLLTIIDDEDTADRKLAANHLAQILTAKTGREHFDAGGFWSDLKAGYMPDAKSYKVSPETASAIISWLHGVAAQPELDDPFEGL